MVLKVRMVQGIRYWIFFSMLFHCILITGLFAGIIPLGHWVSIAMSVVSVSMLVLLLPVLFMILDVIFFMSFRRKKSEAGFVSLGVYIALFNMLILVSSYVASALFPLLFVWTHHALFAFLAITVWPAALLCIAVFSLFHIPVMGGLQTGSVMSGLEMLVSFFMLVAVFVVLSSVVTLPLFLGGYKAILLGGHVHWASILFYTQAIFWGMCVLGYLIRCVWSVLSDSDSASLGDLFSFVKVADDIRGYMLFPDHEVRPIDEEMEQIPGMGEALSCCLPLMKIP